MHGLGHGLAEIVAWGGCQEAHESLVPSLLKYIDGTGITRVVIALLALDTGRIAVLVTGADRKRVA